MYGTARRSKPLLPGHRPGRSGISKTTRPSSLTPAATELLKKAAERRNEDATETKLRISMDYGTKTLAAAFRIDTGENPSPADVHNVHFSERDYFAPQQVAWDEEGTFYWGYDIDKALKRKLIKPDQVIELWKLLMYKDHATTPIAQRVLEQLGTRTLDELLSTHFAEIMTAVKDYVTRHPETRAGYSPQDIQEMDVVLLLSVPQMWKAPANQRMVLAAKAAAIPYVELVYEPQCAAAFYTFFIRNDAPEKLQAGDVLLIADIGGGTGDFVSYTYMQPSSEGAKVGLKIAKSAEGALCGSEWVTQNFLKWFEQEAAAAAGSFDRMCRDLGLTPIACLKQASEKFEAHKQDFSIPDAEPVYVTMRGAQGAKRESWDKKIESKHIVEFFEPIIEKIFACIDKQMTEKTKTCIIPGGFGRNEYLLDRIRERYDGRLEVLGQASDQVGAYQPVTRGAQYRYNDIKERGLKSADAFGFGRTEVWDGRNPAHADATWKKGDRMANGKIAPGRCRNTLLSEPGKFDGEFEVFERWAPILSKGQEKKPGRPIESEEWQLFYIAPDDTELTAQIYWTELDLRPGDPLLVGGRCINTGTIRDGVEKWGPEIKKHLPDFEALGFERKETEDGDCYAVYSRFKLRCDGANVKVSWEIALPGKAKYDEQGEVRNGRVELTDEDVFELADAAFNPNPRTSAT